MEEKQVNSSYKPWSLEYYGYEPEKEKSRESLLTVGNGYFGTRGAQEEATACKTNYPGTYIAGLYNRLISKVADRDIENEDFVNCPNWHHFTFRIGQDEWFALNQENIVSINRELNFKTGVLTRNIVVKDNKNRQTQIISRRFASMANPHLAAIEYTLKPLNYSGSVEVKSLTDGNIINQGVERYNDLNQKHLKPSEQGFEKNYSWLSVETTQSDIEISQAARFTVFKNGERVEANISHSSKLGKTATSIQQKLNEEDELSIKKTVAVHTSKSDDTDTPVEDSRTLIKAAEPFEKILSESKNAWDQIWNEIDIKIEGDPKSQMLIRLHLYHLMVTASPNNVHIDAGIPARGLHGEAYRGHIFWDELYILPLYNLVLPDVAKSILMYRYRRLDKARDYAHKHGYKGAMFPWQSGSDGREETQVVHLNPVSGKWGDDYSSLQRHISIAVAYNTWYYFQITEDIEFMEQSGAEMFLEICRFWASKAKKDEASGKYSISKVMGPDEFHEQHKLSPGGGLKDNAYTNIMVSWLYRKAIEILDKLTEKARDKVLSKIKLEDQELNSWKEISENLNIPVSDEGIIEQFDGYFGLKELDWDAYRKKYKNIYRLDRILKAEGKSPDDYKLAKQADTLMTFYNLDEETVTQIIKESGYKLPDDYLEKNYHYYLERTSHGSTLSRVVHAYLANLFGEKELGKNLYFEALESDFTDIQGGTTAEGIHAGVMGGTVLMAIKSFAGLNFKKEMLEINPHLPENWKSLKFSFRFKNNLYTVSLSRSELKITINSRISEPIDLIFRNKKIILPANKENILKY